MLQRGPNAHVNRHTHTHTSKETVNNSTDS
jgi:hypothetical protein